MAKAKKLPSGNWRVNLFVGYDEKGKRIYKSFTSGNKKEAEFLAAQYAIERKENRTPSRISFFMAENAYIESKDNILSPSTIRGYRIMQRNAFPLLAPVMLSNLTENLIQRQMNENAAHYSPKSLRNQIGFISAVLKMHRVKIDVENISLKPKEKREVQIPTINEVRKIIEILKGSEIEGQILLALLMGLRQSEIAAIRWENVAPGLLKVRGAKVPDEHNHLIIKEQNKSFAGKRDIILPEYVYQILQKQPKKNEFVFQLTPSQVLYRFHRLLNKNELPSFRVHDLRHCNASIMLMLGIPDKYAMERLGQSTNYMLKGVYQHTFSEERGRIDSEINRFFDTMQHEMQHK